MEVRESFLDISFCSRAINKKKSYLGIGQDILKKSDIIFFLHFTVFFEKKACGALLGCLFFFTSFYIVFFQNCRSCLFFFSIISEENAKTQNSAFLSQKYFRNFEGNALFSFFFTLAKSPFAGCILDFFLHKVTLKMTIRLLFLTFVSFVKKMH